MLAPEFFLQLFEENRRTNIFVTSVISALTNSADRADLDDPGGSA